MATATLDLARQFRERLQGFSRAQEVEWFTRELGIDPVSILRLFGYRSADIDRRLAAGATFEQLAESRPKWAVWVSELFRELAFRTGYDMDQLREQIRRARERDADKPTGGLMQSVRHGGPGVFDQFVEYLATAPELS